MFVWAFPTGLTFLWDVMRSKPSLVVDTTGFRDNRTGAAVAWREVSSAEYRYSRVGVASLALRLKTATPTRQNPFRIGYRRKRAEELSVPLQFLEPDPLVLSYVFAHLIEGAGGEVRGKPIDPWSGVRPSSSRPDNVNR
jgi:hypothetical protein